MTGITKTAGLASALMLWACTPGSQPKPGEVEVFDGIGKNEEITLVGTEPFWNMGIEGVTLTYTTPDNMAGTTATVTRFSGNGGLGFSGTLDGQELQIAVTPGDCSDGMSDRTYPFTATVTLGETMLTGCGYTSEHEFRGEENP
jgi:uncharacterized membrane protein